MEPSLDAAEGVSDGPSKDIVGRLRVNDRASSVFLLSFLTGSIEPVSVGASCSSSGADFRPRVASFSLGCFFGGALRSKVGAVVMISGAIPRRLESAAM
jgi:hypothetical protein